MLEVLKRVLLLKMIVLLMIKNYFPKLISVEMYDTVLAQVALLEKNKMAI